MAAILKWMFVLVLLIAVAGSGAAYWLYSRSDEELRLLVLGQLKTMTPDLKFDVARAQLDWSGRVRIYGLTAFLPDDKDRPSVEVPEIIATLDSERLADLDNVSIQKLYLVKPKIRLTRNVEGNWNFGRVAFHITPGSVLADIEIENATIPVEFQLSEKKARKLLFENFNLTAHPADSRRLSILIGTLLKPAGPLTLEIDATLDGSTWKCETRDAWKVPVDQRLIQLICDLSPEAATQVANAGQLMEQAKATQAAVGTITTSPSSPSSPMKLASQLQPKSGIPDFGARCICDLTFRLQKDGPQHPFSFQIHSAIANGEIDNDLLPFPLKEVGGTIYVDNRRIIETHLHASNGATKISFAGDIVPSKPITASIKLRGVELNNALKSRLIEPLRRTIQSMGLTGLCDVDASIIQDGGAWQKQVKLHLTKGTVTHERFPVTVRDVTGELLLEKNVVEFHATGKYAGQLVTAHGEITDPGPAHQANIVVSSKNLPIDDESLAACPTPVLKAIESLKLKGRHDLMLRLSRPAGLGQKYEPDLNERVYDGSLNFHGFPFAIQQLNGFVRWRGDTVKFSQLRGTHDGATLTGEGTFQLLPKPGRLELTIDATDGAFDRALQMALPASLRQVWNDFQPQGHFDVTTEIAWIPGTPCVVKLPKVTVRDGEMLMKSFPWPLQNLSGKFSYNTEPGKLVMEEVRAQHDDAQLSARGVGWFVNGRPWRLDFHQLNVDNLIPNATFRNALPEALQKPFDFLRPTGVFSLAGPVLFFELRPGEKAIGAMWKLDTILSRCGITAGTRVEEINGAIKVEGTWDGNAATLDGKLDLDSLSIFRQATGLAYQINKVVGPISFRDGKFVAGTETAIPPRASDAPDEDKRIRGNVFDGNVFLDSVVELGDELKYQVFVEMKTGRLERYAQQYLRGYSKLAGIMNGWMNLRGKGTNADRMVGEGKMIIAPASLYDSPMLTQIFQVIQLRSPDRSAFEEARLNFSIANGRFDFNSIEFLGESLNMRGRGYVRFDGGMQLDFGLRLRQLIPNPLSPGLMAVKVTGNITDPKTAYVPFPEVDDAMKQFFGVLLDPRKMTPRPGLFTPRTGQQQTEEATR